MKYTSPSKTGEIDEFIVRDEDDTFLGRRTMEVKHPVTGKPHVVGVLRLCAIVDLLAYNVSVPGMTEEEAIAIRANVAFSELSLHAKSTFDGLRRRYLAHMKKRKPKALPKLKTFAEYRSEMLSNWFLSDENLNVARVVKSVL